jgi:uncharacterized protein (DUF58 family)
MALTRRGTVAVAVVVLGFALALFNGPRALLALTGPVLVALLAAQAQVRSVGRPLLERRLPADGFVGERRTVELTFDDPPTRLARIVDDVDDGLTKLDDDELWGTLGRSELSYELRYDRRGSREIGPATIGVRDTLGLVERTFEYEGVDRVLAYPTVYELTGTTTHELNMLAEEAFRRRNREEFDSLREYQRGDSLRDVHWKSSAKRPENDLIVKQFVAEEELGSVEIVAESDARSADAMAEAAASVALYLLDAGVEVGLSTPNRSVSIDAGTDHRLALLRTLARAEAGVASAQEGDTSIHVEGHGGGATVTVLGQSIAFEQLVGPEMTAERRARLVPNAPGDRTDPYGDATAVTPEEVVA